MKKMLCLLLALALMGSLTACGGGQPGGSGTASGGASASSAQGGQSDPTLPADKGEKPEMFSVRPTIAETVLVDELDVRITATGLSYTAYDAELTLSIENNSGQDLSFRSGTMGYSCNSINGYMVDGGYLNADVAAGKKANETIRFSADGLMILGITDIADLEIGFDIDTSDYDTYLQTGPIPLKTSLAETYDYSADTYQTALSNGSLAAAYDYTVDYSAQEALYDQLGIKVLSQAVITNTDGDRALLLEAENTSSEQVYISTGDFRLNGLLVQSGTWSSNSLNPGKRRVAVLNLSSMLDEAYWDIYGLADIADITFSFAPKNLEYVDLKAPEDLTVTLPGVSGSYDASGETLYDEGGVQIVYKGLVDDSSDYSDDIHALLLVSNGTDRPFSADVAYDSLSANGFMTDFLCYGKTVPAGGGAVMDVELQGSSLEENGIDGTDGVGEIEMTVTLRDSNYKTIAEPVITMKPAGT